MDGLAPAIAIKQKNQTRNPRSTVATATEIYDYLRLLYARCGTGHLPALRRRSSSATRSTRSSAPCFRPARGHARLRPVPHRAHRDQAGAAAGLLPGEAEAPQAGEEGRGQKSRESRDQRRGCHADRDRSKSALIELRRRGYNRLYQQNRGPQGANARQHR